MVVVVEKRERGWRVRQEVFSRQGQRGGCRGVLVVGAGGAGGGSRRCPCAPPRLRARSDKCGLDSRGCLF